MAKRVAQKIKSVTGRAASATASKASGTKSLSGFNFTSFFSKFISARATPYVAGGIGLAVIAKYAYSYYKSHPEMVETLKENLGTVEEKLKDYGSKLVGKEELLSDDSRH